MRIRFSKPQRKQKYWENKTSSYSSVKIKFCFYPQLNYPLPRTAIEAEILFAAHIMQVRFWGAVIKPVHPCTGLIARFAQQNALLLRTTDIRVGTEKKTPREQNSSGKKIGAENAVLHFVFFIVMVNKMQQSAKRIRSNKNILMEILSFILILMIMILHGMKRVILFIVIQLIILMMRLHLNRC